MVALEEKVAAAPDLQSRHLRGHAEDGAESWFSRVTESSRESTHCTPDRVMAFMIDRDTSNGTVGIPMALRTEIEDREPPK